jgi:superoxide reductase
MTKLNELYKCNICGNIVELAHEGIGQLVCCGQPMKLLEEKTKDIGNEKHVPIIEKDDLGAKIKVGSIAHPMEEKHYIEFIEIETDKGISRKYLKPGEKPETGFPVKAKIKKVRIYCNVHGLWKNK